MLVCQFCGVKGSEKDGTFEIESNGIGYWCESCDGFNYFDETNRNRFVLILEDKTSKKINATKPKRKFNKRLSPYRYPGGKSKIIDYLYTQLREKKSRKLVSPFTGGGSFELALLDAGIIEELHMNDLDTGVFSLWWTIKYMPFEIIDRIQTITPTHSDFFKAQDLIFRDYEGANVIEAAWASLLVNRLAYSGISKANPLGGKNGGSEQLLSRWNPEELIRRIRKIHSLSERIQITQMNAVELIEEAYWETDTTIFIDPPYVEKGKELYLKYYTKEDHIELSVLLDSLYLGCPGADIIVTYDYQEFIKDLYIYPEIKTVNRRYSA